LKSWTYRYRLNGKQGVFVLGNYYDGRTKPPDHVSAEEARRRRNETRALIKQGLNPAQERRSRKQQTLIESENTFRSVAQLWIEFNRAHWSPDYLKKVNRFLDKNAYPVIGKIPLRSMNSSHVLDVLHRIEKRGAATVASEVRQMISGVFRYAIPRRLADIDHAAPLKGTIKRPAVKNKTPMTEDDIRDFLKKLEKQPRPMAIALKLILLLFPRPGNIAGAEWAEFNLDKAEWKVQAEKMKTRKPFASPLPRQAVSLLRKLKDIGGSERWLFPKRDKPEFPIHRTSLNSVMRRLGYAKLFSPHCARATAKTLLLKHGYPENVIERQLAHSRDRVESAYNHYEYFEERRAMLQTYASLIDQWERGMSLVNEAGAA